MPNLNTIELQLLTKLALNPAPKRSWADYKRVQRQKAKARTPEGRMLVTSDNISKALIDAIADCIRSGTPDLTISQVIQTASHRFPVPAVAEVAIKSRLANRKPAQPNGGQGND